MPAYTTAEQGYFNLWNKADVRPNRISAAKSIAERILAMKSTFYAVEQATGVPWQWVGAILSRESGLSLKGAFANGDPIIGTGKRTKHVPAGRGPFSTWAASAIDEINRRGLSRIGRANWSVERMLFEAEAYNGWGYLGKCNSPYDWSFTTEYGPPEQRGGKFIADGVWNSGTLDSQCGVAAIWKELALLDADTAVLINQREPVGHPTVIANATKQANAGKRKVGAGAAVAGTAGAANTVHNTSTAPPEHFLSTPAGIIAMGFGLTIVVIVTVMSIKTGNLLKARW